MRRIVLAIGLGLMACATFAPRGVILFAQSLPTMKHVSWTPNPVGATATQFSVTVDGGAPIIIPAASCTATCSQVISLSTFGSHTVVIVAQNRGLSTDPALQDSPAATITFTLQQAPQAVTGANVTN